MGLLASSSFSKHLSAVRETNNLLMRALNVRQYDDGESIKVHSKITLYQALSGLFLLLLLNRRLCF